MSASGRPGPEPHAERCGQRLGSLVFRIDCHHDARQFVRFERLYSSGTGGILHRVMGLDSATPPRRAAWDRWGGRRQTTVGSRADHQHLHGQYMVSREPTQTRPLIGRLFGSPVFGRVQGPYLPPPRRSGGPMVGRPRHAVPAYRRGGTEHRPGLVVPVEPTRTRVRGGPTALRSITHIRPTNRSRSEVISRAVSRRIKSPDRRRQSGTATAGWSAGTRQKYRDGKSYPWAIGNRSRASRPLGGSAGGRR